MPHSEASVNVSIFKFNSLRFDAKGAMLFELLAVRISQHLMSRQESAVILCFFGWRDGIWNESDSRARATTQLGKFVGRRQQFLSHSAKNVTVCSRCARTAPA